MSVPTYALIGWPLTFSLSPAIHGAAFRAAGVPGRYVLEPTPPHGLAAFVAGVRAGAWAGANVTLPHKTAVRDLLDDESRLVAATGAVNTLLVSDGGVRGENTDVAGCLHALTALGAADGAGRPALVIGAGGAARAVVHALLQRDYAVLVLSRRAARAAVVAGALARAWPGARLGAGLLTAERLTAEAERARLLVHCTPLGAAGPDTSGRSVWPDHAPFPAHMAVLDLVTVPAPTCLVARATAAGAPAAGGLDMLIGQAAEAWRLWTGVEPPLEAMTAAARAAAARAAAVHTARS